MKKVFLFAALVAASFTGIAQDGGSDVRGLKFNGGVHVDIPVSNLDNASIGAGLDILGQYGFTDNLAVTLDAGYTSFFPKEVNGQKGDNFGIIPIRAGIRFFATPQLYIGAKGGVGIGTATGSETMTAYSFGAGYMMSSKLDVGASYDGYSKGGSIGAIGIRVGYYFGGK